GEIHAMCRGIDPRPVEPRRDRKSVSCETTLAEPIAEPGQLDEILDDLFERLTGDLQQRQSAGIFVKLKNSQFELTSVARRDLPPESPHFKPPLTTAWQRSQPLFRLVVIAVRLDTPPWLQMTLPL